MKAKNISPLKNNKGEIDKKNITAVTFLLPCFKTRISWMSNKALKCDELKQKVIFILQGWAKYNLQPDQSVRKARIYMQISDKSI